jgi:hypothetical protein
MIQINDTVLATAVELGMDEFLQVFTRHFSQKNDPFSAIKFPYFYI